VISAAARSRSFQTNASGVELISLDCGNATTQPASAVVVVQRDQQRIAERIRRLVGHREHQVRARRGGILPKLKVRAGDERVKSRQRVQASEARVSFEPVAPVAAAFSERAVEQRERRVNTSGVRDLARFDEVRMAALERVRAQTLELQHRTILAVLGAFGPFRASLTTPAGQANFRPGIRQPIER
jgi:hypothetical protein